MSESCEGYEIRRNSDGTLDYVFSAEVSNVHLESMGDGDWWLSITTEDDDRITIRWKGSEPVVEIE